MTQIFIVGSSSAYGAGGHDGGWADMLKRHIHNKMYGPDGVGDQHEVYNFSKPGALVQFVKETFPEQLSRYRNRGKTVAIISVGGNNAKAENTPDNFISSIDEFKGMMEALLEDIKSRVDQVIVMGYRPHDETKTLPKPNPFTGGLSYFWNARTAIFDKALSDLCAQLGVSFIELSIPQEEWLHDYIYSDGLHPNHRGHQAICDRVIEQLEL